MAKKRERVAGWVIVDTDRNGNVCVCSRVRETREEANVWWGTLDPGERLCKLVEVERGKES